MTARPIALAALLAAAGPALAQDDMPTGIGMLSDQRTTVPERRPLRPLPAEPPTAGPDVRIPSFMALDARLESTRYVIVIDASRDKLRPLPEEPDR